MIVNCICESVSRNSELNTQLVLKRQEKGRCSFNIKYCHVFGIPKSLTEEICVNITSNTVLCQFCLLFLIDITYHTLLLDHCLEYILPNPIFRKRQWHPTPALLPGKSHGRRSLVGCGPWGRTESDMTEAT